MNCFPKIKSEIRNKARRGFLFTLVFFSGLSGLVYEVVWHRYLTILLGAQARATSLVLAIFLGGDCLGYECFGHWSRWKKWNLITTYALVEAGIGIWAFVFPYLFHGALLLTSKLYLALGLNSIAIDILVSVLLLGFPTFLMGGTLPLLTQALSEDVTEASRTHAKLYGLNTIGACLGSVLAGYVLIPFTTLPISLVLAGVVNLVVAVGAYGLFSGREVLPPSPPSAKNHLTRKEVGIFLVAFISGISVLTLEAVLIRMMGLATGSSNYNFTLIVSIFIFGLGIGSLLLRKITRLSPKHLFINQLAIGFTLYLLYLTLDQWSYWAHVLRLVFRNSPENFYIYEAALGLGVSFLLIIPVGLSGLTLPLCFHLLKEDKESLGLRVGKLYGINTLGCVLGSLLGGYYLFNFFNIDELMKLCVLLSVLGSIISAVVFFPRLLSIRQVAFGGVVILTTVVGVLTAPWLSRERLTQAFRVNFPTPVSYQGADAFGKYLFNKNRFLMVKDGADASVAISASFSDGKETARTIFVNGKSDGSTLGDYFTMNMTAHVPALLTRDLDQSCVIGFGTGITIGSLAQYRESKSIDVAEISDTIIKNASLFDPYNGEASKSSKIHFHQMDAFRYLEGTGNSFGLIISEPSNPWVSGVENLYTGEFYETAKKHLTSDGIFAQWLQAYSFNDDLVRMVLNTLNNHFSAVYVFQLKEYELLLVATQKPFTKADLERAESRVKANDLVKSSLLKSGVTHMATILAMETLTPRLSRITARGAKEHSLETPRLSNQAAQASFANSLAEIYPMRRGVKEFYSSGDEFLLHQLYDGKEIPRSVMSLMRSTFCDYYLSVNVNLCKELLISEAGPRDHRYEAFFSRAEVSELNRFRDPNISANFSGDDFKETHEDFNFFQQNFSPITKLSSGNILLRLDRCLAQAPLKSALYGDCLLERTAVLELTDASKGRFFSSVSDFISWVSLLPPETPGEEKYRNASHFLKIMLTNLD